MHFEITVTYVRNHRDTEAERHAIKEFVAARAALPLCLCASVVSNVCDRNCERQYSGSETVCLKGASPPAPSNTRGHRPRLQFSVARRRRNLRGCHFASRALNMTPNEGERDEHDRHRPGDGHKISKSATRLRPVSYIRTEDMTDAANRHSGSNTRSTNLC